MESYLNVAEKLRSAGNSNQPNYFLPCCRSSTFCGFPGWSSCGGHPRNHGGWGPVLFLDLLTMATQLTAHFRKRSFGLGKFENAALPDFM